MGSKLKALLLTVVAGGALAWGYFAYQRTSVPEADVAQTENAHEAVVRNFATHEDLPIVLANERGENPFGKTAVEIPATPETQPMAQDQPETNVKPVVQAEGHQHQKGEDNHTHGVTLSKDDTELMEDMQQAMLEMKEHMLQERDGR